MKKLFIAALLVAPLAIQAQTIDTAVPTVQELVTGCPGTYLAGSRTVDLTPNKNYELEAGCTLKEYHYAATGLNAELRNADIADAATVDAGTATDKVMSVAETKRLVDTISHGSWLSDVADITARDAIITYQNGDKVYVGDDGDTNWAVYSARADSPTAANWYKISDFDDLNQPIATLTQAQVESTTGADYTSVGLATSERLDQWGRSRKLQRVFNVNSAFDFAALNYGDKEAIYVRNNSAVNGIGVTYGTGGANTLLITRADGTVQTIAGQDSFNVQPSEIVVMEQEGADIRASIIPGERISKRENYAAAAAFAAYPHDGIVLIQDTGEIFGRKTDTNTAAFPADGQANADWWKVGGVQTDTKILQTISVAVRSFGTNASSRAAISFVDKDGATYPAADWRVSGTIPQYAGGGGPIVLSNNAWGGSITLGHNKDGNILFSYVGQNANGLSAINYIGTNSADSDGAIVVSYAGTDFSESFAGKALVTTSDWTALPVFASSTPINPDDITEWSDTESNIPLGALRKVTGTPTAIYGRTVDDATADGGVLPDGTKWQDVTAQVTPALITVDSDAEGPTYFALYDKPQPRRYLVTGSTNITMLFPSDGGANVDSQALVINKGTGNITVDGGTIAENMSALITADGGVDGPQVQLIGGGSSAIRGFDSIADTDNETFADGEIIMTRSEGVGGVAWVFELAATEGDYEIADVVSGYFNKLREQTQTVILDSDGGANEFVSFSQADPNFGDFVNDLDPTAKFYYIKRNAASTETQGFESGVTTVIPADDFDWYLFRRINITTVEFMGKPFTSSADAPQLSSIHPHVVADSTATQADSDQVITQLLRPVKATNISGGSPLDLEYAITNERVRVAWPLPQSQIRTLQMFNASNDSYAIDILTNGTAQQNIVDASELAGSVTVEDRGTERVIEFEAPTATIFKLWSGQAGNPGSGHAFDFGFEEVKGSLEGDNNLRVEIPVGDSSIISTAWSLTDLGFDPTVTSGRLVLESDLADLEIELPMVPGRTSYAGIVNNSAAWQIRATHQGGNNLGVATGRISTDGGTTTLQRIWYYKPQTEVVDPNLVEAEDISAISRSGNNNPGNGNPFQHSDSHLNAGDIVYAAGTYTIGTAGNYAIDYGIQAVQGNNSGNVSAGLFVNGIQQGAGIGLSNDNSNNWPFGGSSEVSLTLSAGDTIELRQTGTPGFGGTNKTTSISITQIPSKTVINPADAVLPTSFSDLGIWNGVNLQTLVTNGMIIGNGTGAAGTGAPHGAFTGSMKVTAIGDWIQQDFLTGNAPGTVVGERFSRQSFNGGTTWSAWFGQ